MIESKNMNYFFNVQYFKQNSGAYEFERYNNEIKDFQFPATLYSEALSTIDGYCDFNLYTTYPGLLIGTGNPHDISENACIKCGFSFDYVTGLPYIPGSSLKGVIRSYFPDKNSKHKSEYKKLIQGLISQIKGYDFGEDIGEKLIDNIFDNNDIFIGGYPEEGEKLNLMEMDYITPHKEFKNPIPINIIKIEPNVEMKFAFILNDFQYGDITITKEDKRDLFKEIICLMGVGAKTNVGYGKMSDKKCDPYVDESNDRKANKSRKQSKQGNNRNQGGNNNNKNNPNRNKSNKRF